MTRYEIRTTRDITVDGLPLRAGRQLGSCTLDTGDGGNLISMLRMGQAELIPIDDDSDVEVDGPAEKPPARTRKPAKKATAKKATAKT